MGEKVNFIFILILEITDSRNHVSRFDYFCSLYIHLCGESVLSEERKKKKKKKYIYILILTLCRARQSCGLLLMYTYTFQNVLRQG